ncbi:hypothetical protein HDU92_007513 [Lobulomyces angularis]|nr:hypothetical protein HDU92_007513 [Lobulomyces angularis]
MDDDDANKFFFEREIVKSFELTKKKEITRLIVIDFDSTLFCSPMPNVNIWTSELLGHLISDCGWFIAPETLSEPYIPKKPSSDWFDEECVKQVIQEQQRVDTFVILLTGRRRDLFKERIEELINTSDFGFNFDLILLKELSTPNNSRSFQTTFDYKCAVLKNLLNYNENFKEVKIFDDRKHHLNLFKKELEKFYEVRSLNIEIVLVTHLLLQQKFIVDQKMEIEMVNQLIDFRNQKIRLAVEREEQYKNNKSARSSESNLGQAKDFIKESPLPRKLSASIFRNFIELEEQLEKRTIILDSDSKSKLLSLFIFHEENEDFKNLILKNLVNFEFVISKNLISLQKDLNSYLADINFFKFGRKYKLEITSTGVLQGMLVAVKISKIEIMFDTEEEKLNYLKEVANCNCHQEINPSAENSKSEIEKYTTLSLELNAYSIDNTIVLGMENGVKKRDVRLIKDWKVLQNESTGQVEKIFVYGQMNEVFKIGLKNSKLTKSTSNSQMPQEIKFGEVVLKHHPNLKGKQIGIVIEEIKDYLSRTFMENKLINKPYIESFVFNLDLKETFRKFEFNQNLNNGVKSMSNISEN